MKSSSNYSFFQIWLLTLFICLMTWPTPVKAQFELSLPGASAELATSSTDVVLHVNNQHLQASDSHSGEANLPYETVSAAIEQAIQNRENGLSTTIIIHPGLYRESLVMDLDSRAVDPLIALSAQTPGTVIISGSTVWIDWEPTNNPDIYSEPWPFKWGLATIPDGWEGNVAIDPLIRHREMVIVNNEPLFQVLHYEALHQGSFFISEEAEKIFIYPPTGVDLNTTLIEVAVRGPLLKIHGKSNLVVQGLTFQHSASGLQDAAVEISHGSHILVEDNQFLWNGWDGINFMDVHDLTTKRNLSTYNGGSGRTAAYLKDFLSEDDEASFNNRRGLQGNFLYWAVAGTKYLHVHNAIIRRHTAQGNHATGLWFDTDNENILIEDSRWCGNLKAGLFIEANQGPITVRDSSIYQNDEWGIRAISSKHVSLEGNEIYNNDGFQIQIPDALERTHENWETGELIRVDSVHWSFTGNTISGDISLLESPTTGQFLTTLYSSNNLWHNPQTLFIVKMGTEYLQFAQWQELTEQDLNSRSDPDSSIGLLESCPYHPLVLTSP